MKVRFKVQLTEEEQLKREYKKRSGRLCIAAVVSLVISCFIIYAYLKKNEINWIWLAIAICSMLIIIMHNIFVGAIDTFYNKLADKVDKYAEDAKLKEKENRNLIELHAQKEEQFRKVIQSRTPFTTTAMMFADWESVVFAEAEHFLRNKQHPAQKAADAVSQLRKDARKAIMESKEMEYKYLFLLDAFPELKNYVDDEESLIHLSDYNNYCDFVDGRDRVLDWISQEEYNRLSIDERNQLALDKYKRRHKSNWEVGMEYELYIGYLLRKDGFFIKQFGIENGLNDLGRDILAEKAHLDGSRAIYIVQCKNWSQNKQLHENVVCQLFGTTLEYQIRHQHFMNTKITPLLVTTTELSDTAKEFAKRLGVIVKIVPMGEYPMIKCNIDSMIYHLPFDQQYYTTQIKESKGERYVWTVKEATSLGYRRAMRWKGVE